MSAFTQWVEETKALLQQLHGDDWRVHGGPVVMPSNVPPSMQRYVGQPAAMFDNATYVELANSGLLDMRAPQVASNSGKVVFVLAPAAVIASAPKTMTAVQALANTVFTAGDIAADAVGLPEAFDFVKSIGKEVLVGVGVALGVALALKFFAGRKR